MWVFFFRIPRAIPVNLLLHTVCDSCKHTTRFCTQKQLKGKSFHWQLTVSWGVSRINWIFAQLCLTVSWRTFCIVFLLLCVYLAECNYKHIPIFSCCAKCQTMVNQWAGDIYYAAYMVPAPPPDLIYLLTLWDCLLFRLHKCMTRIPTNTLQCKTITQT